MKLANVAVPAALMLSGSLAIAQSAQDRGTANAGTTGSPGSSQTSTSTTGSNMNSSQADYDASLHDGSAPGASNAQRNGTSDQTGTSGTMSPHAGSMGR